MRLPDGRSSAFAMALAALQHGAIAQAKEIGESLLRDRPDDPVAQQLMAAVALKAGDHAEAERWSQASLAERPDHAPTLVLAAQAARIGGHPALAASRFKRAMDLDRNRPDAAFGACIVLIEQGGVDVRPVIEDLLARFPDHAPGWSEIGGLLERAGQLEAALVAWSRAARAMPSALLHLRRGSALQALGRLDEAAEALQQAVALDPVLVPAWFKLGLVLQDRHDPTGAIAAYRRALALQDDLPEAEVNLGVVLQETGDLVAAKQAYGRAIRLRPSSFSRIAQALTTAPKGELWMDLGALRAHLSEEGRLSR